MTYWLIKVRTYKGKGNKGKGLIRLKELRVKGVGVKDL